MEKITAHFLFFFVRIQSRKFFYFWRSKTISDRTNLVFDEFSLCDSSLCVSLSPTCPPRLSFFVFLAFQVRLLTFYRACVSCASRSRCFLCWEASIFSKSSSLELYFKVEKKFKIFQFVIIVTFIRYFDGMAHALLIMILCFFIFKKNKI